MNHDELNRRKFNHLAAAALGGMMAGASFGCRSKSQPPPATSGAAPAGGAREGEVAAGDKNLCRGLNDCKGLGAGGDNACAGQGACATYEHHDCHQLNACKGQGGCGETAGLNECAGKGECAVPLMEGAWEKVRARKEEAWDAAGKEFGEAPPKS